MQCDAQPPSSQLMELCRTIESSPLESTMKRLYEEAIGPYWMGLLPEKASREPWSFHFMLDCLETNWASAFAPTLPRHLRYSIQRLKLLLPPPHTLQITQEQLHRLIRETDAFLLAIGINLSETLAKLDPQPPS